MESIRQKQVGELIRRELSGILLHEGRYIYGNVMVTITNVKMTPDLLVARLFVSIFNAADKKEVLRKIHGHLTMLRTELAKKTGKQLRRVPTLELFLDESLDEVEKLDRLFGELNTSSSEEDEVA